MVVLEDVKSVSEFFCFSDEHAPNVISENVAINNKVNFFIFPPKIANFKDDFYHQLNYYL